MTTLLLIRHADTDAVGQVLAGSRPGWPLNKRGRKEAIALSGQLENRRLHAVYTSPLARARETAHEIAAAHGVEPKEERALTEMNFGQWEGQRFEELKNDEAWKDFNQNRSRARPPDGESMTEVQTRMTQIVTDIQRQHGDAEVALVSHAEPLRCLIAHWLRITLDDVLRLRIDPASVSIVHLWPGWAEIACVNAKADFPL